MKYSEFLEKKKIVAHSTGLDISLDEINPVLFDFQKALVKWACKKGRSAIFADCGLGKTFIQLEWARLIKEKTDLDILIVAPLAVTLQTIKEAERLNLSITKCRKQDDYRSGINITNYEMLNHFDSSKFGGVVLDESSILKSYMGKIKRQIIEMFRDAKYKLCCTATPSPNDHMEILNHSEFLGVMESHKTLAIWFINDSMNMGKYRIKNHAIKEFWEWVSSWAISLSHPSDLGYENNDFNLPELNIIETVIPVDITNGKDGWLFRMPALNATDYHREKRLTCNDRAKKTTEIIAQSEEIFCVWCDTNYEADALKKAIPEAIEVRGNHSIEYKEQKSIDFASGKIKTLISKPSIFGFGMNFQACHNIIYCGMNFSYESFYQSTRRFWRFGQKKPVNVNIIYGETEKRIIDIIRRKELDFNILKKNMILAMDSKKHLQNERQYKMDYVHKETTSKDKKWKLICGDIVEEIKAIESESIHFSIFSPPFSNYYIYSDSYRDMGNCKTDDEFFTGFGFMIPDLYRITIPGRLCAIHCKQLVNYKGRDNEAGLRDFRGEIIRNMIANEWIYHSEVCIWKSPVTEMYRTKAHGLLYKQTRKDSTYSRQGLPDYLIIFRKWSKGEEDPEPVNWKTKENFELPKWQSYASPVWFDIQQTDVLNIREAKSGKDEKHICPLQLGVIERALELWTNPKDLVFSPFAGIGSEGYVALELGRQFLGVELKEEYYNTAIKNLERAKEKQLQAELALF